MNEFPGSAAMALAAGARLGPYEVLVPIGAGGMGEVYRARDTRLGRDVAVKLLPAERLADPHRRARFVQEARAASALNHPHIVTIHEIESAEGIDFIVMELVPGETLAQRLRRGALGTDEALRLAIPVADALAAAHAAGIVHRDLKPGNVMVRPDGVAKVLDFGLAKLMRGDSADSDDATATAPPDAAPLSRPGAVTGTAGYMSPEQASGGTVDARSDVFSFGLLLYEMITGRRAFAGSSSAAPTGSRYPLRYWDAATGQDRQVGAIDAVYVAGLSVSPDGGSLLYGRSSWACDLMMIEDFR